MELPQLAVPPTKLAFVLLESPFRCESAALAVALRDYGGPEVTVPEDEEGEEGGEVIALHLEGVGTAFLALMDLPIPEGEAEAAYPYSIASLGDDQQGIRPHQAHLMVSLMVGETTKSPAEVLSDFTSLLAAICDVAPAVGIYWGDAGATHPVEYFQEIARDSEQAGRVMLWTGLSRAPEKGGKMSMLSLGMNQLGLPDLYMITPMTSPGEAIGRFFDLLSYMISRGEAIPDGDTVGVSETERIAVKYVKSPADDGSVVWRVEF
ncbi:MAG: DUF4261 domain-containing protein [Roseibacillus sp.]